MDSVSLSAFLARRVLQGMVVPFPKDATQTRDVDKLTEPVRTKSEIIPQVVRRACAELSDGHRHTLWQDAESPDECKSVWY